MLLDGDVKARRVKATEAVAREGADVVAEEEAGEVAVVESEEVIQEVFAEGEGVENGCGCWGAGGVVALEEEAVLVPAVGVKVKQDLAAALEPIDAARVRRQALDLVHECTESWLALCLKTAWTAPGGGLVNTGLATACSPDNALKFIERLLVYPWKCLVHLHGTELGLGLGVCTLGLSPAAVEAALRFARCPEIDLECIRGSGCKGHEHCRPCLYKDAVGSYADLWVQGFWASHPSQCSC